MREHPHPGESYPWLFATPQTSQGTDYSTGMMSTQENKKFFLCTADVLVPSQDGVLFTAHLSTLISHGSNANMCATSAVVKQLWQWSIVPLYLHLRDVVVLQVNLPSC